MKRTHNGAIAGRHFAKLEPDLQRQILAYEFSTHTLPSSMDDRGVLQMFARLNSTGVKLNGQELRNAEYFGDFKTLMYNLAYEQLERWRKWSVFSEDEIARMREVELVSDLSKSLIDGLSAKSQKVLNDLYGRYDDHLPSKGTLSRRFRSVMTQIDEMFGSTLNKTVFNSEVYFFTLFTYLYQHMWGLGSPLDKTSAKTLHKERLRKCLVNASERFETQEVPPEVLDAVQRASADIGRRRTRLKFLQGSCG